MKEYLVKKDGVYVATNLASSDCIEIPDGADILVEYGKKDWNVFYKDNFKEVWQGSWQKTIHDDENLKYWKNLPVLWRREKTVEYLDPSDWSLVIAGENEQMHDRSIRVPEGAEAYMNEFDDSNTGGFYKDSYTMVYDLDDEDDGWCKCHHDLETLLENGKLRWTRHTQPEALPFIDDETNELEKAFCINAETIKRNASDIADAALKHIRERALTYDQADGERSAAKTAKAFNAITGKDITESEVWLMLQLLKDVRQWSRDEYHVDSAEDCIAYAALKAESLEKSNVSHNQGS